MNSTFTNFLSIGDLLPDDEIDLYLSHCDSMSWLTQDSDGTVNWTAGLQLDRYITAICSPASLNDRHYSPVPWVLDLFAARAAARATPWSQASGTTSPK